ncbi:VOC family protein [Jiulongibacter sp. NS-SX5]|uniref:VOC family protein n=1 Tax=Jiulongibacter sp. NS-SX5 TaxID=3463854 RepID=UPI004059C683
MEFKYTILYVSDVKKTLTFYQKAFGFATKFMTPEEDYGELLTGNTALSFASLKLANSNLRKGFKVSTVKEQPFGIELAFITSQIHDDAERALAAGAILAEPIQAKPWGQTIAYLRDINGFLIELGSPME